MRWMLLSLCFINEKTKTIICPRLYILEVAKAVFEAENSALNSNMSNMSVREHKTAGIV
jgi:hypothetical protein